jgi:hypothetical protein
MTRFTNAQLRAHVSCGDLDLHGQCPKCDAIREALAACAQPEARTGSSENRLEMPTRSTTELVEVLRTRAQHLIGEPREKTATVAMMLEAADRLEHAEAGAVSVGPLQQLAERWENYESGITYHNVGLRHAARELRALLPARSAPPSQEAEK